MTTELPVFEIGDRVVQIASADVETRRPDGIPVIFRITAYFDPSYHNDFMWAECESGDLWEKDRGGAPYRILLRPRHAWRRYVSDA